MRAFMATLYGGTSSFSPIPIGPADFSILRGGVPEAAEGLHPRVLPQHAFRREARARGWEAVESVCATAQPAGRVNRKAYESLRDEILADLRAAMPVDIVCLSMYGGMQAFGHEDCEVDLLERVRAIVGPEVPVGIAPNHHSNLTRRLVELATAVVSYKEYPHTDHGDRAAELFRILADAAEGKVRPHMAVFDCRMIGHYHTNRQPMRGWTDRLMALEGKDGVLSVSPVHGFIHSDTAEAGTKILVITDDRPEQGAALAARLGRELFALRGEILPRYLSVRDAVARAAASRDSPVVIAECSDNPHGSAGGDGTAVIRALMDAGVTDVAIAPIYDPFAVKLAQAAGEGAELEMRFGGKLGRLSGAPLDLPIRIEALVADVSQGHLSSGVPVRFPLGDCARLSHGETEFVLSSVRQQTFSTECFTALGIDPAAKRALVVKSMIEFRGAFEPIASETLFVEAQMPDSGDQGVLLRAMGFERIQRPIWPLDELEPV